MFNNNNNNNKDMCNSLKETLQWMQDHVVFLKSMIESMDMALDYHPTYSKKTKQEKGKILDELARDFKILVRKVQLFKEKISFVDDALPAILYLDELNDYCSVIGSFLDKAETTGLLPDEFK